jgi:hypothetical protein
VGEHAGRLAPAGQGQLHQPPALLEHRPAGRRHRPGLQPALGRGLGEAVLSVKERLHVERARQLDDPAVAEVGQVRGRQPAAAMAAARSVTDRRTVLLPGVSNSTSPDPPVPGWVSP